MANIAQTINVLQAVILTEGEKMLKTPTYHVFEMYKVHQDATLLPIDLYSEDYNSGDSSIPQISSSASKNKDGLIHISLCNVHHERSAALDIELRGTVASKVTGRILTSDDMRDHNTFQEPEKVQPTTFNGFKLEQDSEAGKLKPWGKTRAAEASVSGQSIILETLQPWEVMVWELIK